MATRISIVSAKRGIGKTTLTANLGAMLADLGKRILLLDAILMVNPIRTLPIGLEEAAFPMETTLGSSKP